MSNNEFTPLVPFMPFNPQMGNAYVPYQLNVDEFCLDEGFCNGTLYKCLYSEYIGNVKGGDVLCQICKIMK